MAGPDRPSAFLLWVKTIMPGAVAGHDECELGVSL